MNDMTIMLICGLVSTSQLLQCIHPYFNMQTCTLDFAEGCIAKPIYIEGAASVLREAAHIMYGDPKRPQHSRVTSHVHA